ANVKAFSVFLNGLEIADEELTTQTSFNIAGMRLKYDSSKWKQYKGKALDAVVQRVIFAHSKGDGYAMVITEKPPVPTQFLAAVVLENARAIDPNAQLVHQETRILNDGTEALCLQIEATLSGVPFTYYSYNFSTKSSTVQVIMYTAKSLFAEYKSEFQEF